jgi:hypothetical protein
MEMIELKEEPMCCGKKMSIGGGQSMNTEENIDEWVCLECGRFIQLIDGQMDEEQLEEYKENNVEE